MCIRDRWSVGFKYAPALPVWHDIYAAKEGSTVVSAKFESRVLKVYDSGSGTVAWDSVGDVTFTSAPAMDKAQAALGNVIVTDDADPQGVIVGLSSGEVDKVAGLDGGSLSTLTTAEEFIIVQPGFRFGPFNCKIIEACHPDFTAGSADTRLVLQPRVSLDMPTTLYTV